MSGCCPKIDGVDTVCERGKTVTLPHTRKSDQLYRECDTMVGAKVDWLVAVDVMTGDRARVQVVVI